MTTSSPNMLPLWKGFLEIKKRLPYMYIGLQSNIFFLLDSVVVAFSTDILRIRKFFASGALARHRVHVHSFQIFSHGVQVDLIVKSDIVNDNNRNVGNVENDVTHENVEVLLLVKLGPV